MWSQVWEILWFHARMTEWPPPSRKTTPNISCIQRNAPWGNLPNNCGNACLNLEDFRVAFLFPGLRFLTHLFNSVEVRQQNQFLQASELTLDHYALLASLGAMVALLLWSPWTPIWWKAEDVACQNGRRFCLFIPPTLKKKYWWSMAFTHCALMAVCCSFKGMCSLVWLFSLWKACQEAWG